MANEPQPGVSPETTAPAPETTPTPQSAQEGYYMRQFEKAQKELEKFQKAEEDRKKADMSEVERLKAESAEKDRRIADTQTKADQRIVNAEARVQAVALGVKADRVKAVLKLADLSQVTVGDDGEPDAKALTAALNAVIADYPEFGGEQPPPKQAGDFPGPRKTAANTKDDPVRRLLEGRK